MVEKQVATRPALPHIPALDGIRALSVIGVILYHAGVSWMPGGFLGVEVFFVVSGYVITSLLVSEQRISNTVDLRRFWRRRIRRLVPALAALLVGVAALALLFWADDVAGFRPEMVASSVYLSNWYLILAERSYFAEIGRPSPLRHLWSLAVEVQFYALWPLIFRLTARRVPSRRAFGAIAAAAALCSAILALVLFKPGVDPSRVYYGADTRAAGLLLGAALALVWSPWEQGLAPSLNRRRAETAIGAACLGLLAVAFVYVDELADSTYRGGILAVSAATTILIAATVRPGNMLGERVLGNRLARAIGQRSYSLYLWHWPVFVVTRPGSDIQLDGVAGFVLRVAIAAALSELSYQLVEVPFRRGGAANLFRSIRDGLTSSSRLERLGERTSAFTAIAAIVVPLSIVGVGVAVAEAPAITFDATPRSELGLEIAAGPQPIQTPATQQRRGPVAIDSAPADAAVPEHAPQPATGDTAAAPTSPAPTTPPTAPPPTAPPLPPRDPGLVIAVGDSVLLSAAPALDLRFASIAMDAAIARQPVDGVDIVEKWRAAGGGADTVVIALGSNGTFHAADINRTMQLLWDIQRVVFVNARVDRPWAAPNNAALAEIVPQYPTARLVDWSVLADLCDPGEEGTVFAPDDVHLDRAGADCYADAVLAASSAG